MIKELKAEDYYKIKEMVKDEGINLEIKSVIQGYNPGWVFVDDVIEPKTAMVWSKGIAGFYFLGEASNPVFKESINEYIDLTIAPRGKSLGLNSFEFSGTSLKWENQLKRLFKNRELRISRQFVYKQGLEEACKKYTTVNEAYRLKPVSKALLQDESYETSFLEEGILEWWTSQDAFLKNGIGYCILHNHKVVCSCVTSFMSAKTMESHIVTKENHQGKGLATAAVSAFVNEAKEKEKGYNLYWDCMEKNHPSRALAVKNGYLKAYDYTLFGFNFDG